MSMILLAAACGHGPHGTQYLVITVDTEAQPARATDAWVDRLIYGDFGPGQRAGIDEMMDAADHAGVKVTFFLDVVEEMLYPGEIQAVAEHIAARGHDVELHTHPDVAPPELWDQLGFASTPTNEFTEPEARALFGWVQNEIDGWNIAAPIAYRAGGYRYSAGIVEAMPDFGLRESYDYNLEGKSQSDSTPSNLPTFAWENGVVEIPISYYPTLASHHRFDDSSYRSGDAYDDIGAFQDQFDQPTVMTLMLHSWSLLHLDDAGHFEYDGDQRRRDFADFLDGLPDTVVVVTPRDVDRMIADGTLAVPVHESTADIFP